MRFSYTWSLQTPYNDELFVYDDFCLSPEECDKVIEIGLDTKITDHENPAVSKGEGWAVDISVRKGSIGWIRSVPETEWLFRKMTDNINAVNNRFFNYDLLNIENFQFTIYNDTSDFYGAHIDMMHRCNATRKLSFSVQLSDPETYEGGDLVFYFNKNGESMGKQRGKGIFFPSWTLHEVKPVTKGTRYALVGWVNGPRFR